MAGAPNAGCGGAPTSARTRGARALTAARALIAISALPSYAARCSACDHVYCHGCASRCFSVKEATCPLCTKPVSETDIVELTHAPEALDSMLVGAFSLGATDIEMLSRVLLESVKFARSQTAIYGASDGAAVVGATHVSVAR
jgi:hypothetical protein